MAIRPIFIPIIGADLVKEVPVSFKWSPGMAVSQKKKNVIAIQAGAKVLGFEPLLEISTKSDSELGRRCSAFNLRYKCKDGVWRTVEGIFHGSKVFSHGGPYFDLLDMIGGEIKKDTRLVNSGKLIAFEFEDTRWPLEPKTLFYDWIYIQALIQNYSSIEEIINFAGFSDIEFNPKRSINCQARSAALFVSIKRNRIEEMIYDNKTFIKQRKKVEPMNLKQGTLL